MKNITSGWGLIPVLHHSLSHLWESRGPPPQIAPAVEDSMCGGGFCSAPEKLSIVNQHTPLGIQHRKLCPVTPQRPEANRCHTIECEIFLTVFGRHVHRHCLCKHSTFWVRLYVYNSGDLFCKRLQKNSSAKMLLSNTLRVFIFI